MNKINISSLKFKIVMGIIIVFFIFMLLNIINFILLYDNFFKYEEDKINIYSSSLVNELDNKLLEIKKELIFISNLLLKNVSFDSIKRNLIYNKNVDFYNYNDKASVRDKFFINKIKESIEISEVNNKYFIDFNIENKFMTGINIPVSDLENKKGILFSQLNSNNNFELFESISEPDYFDWQLLITNKKGILLYHSHKKIDYNDYNQLKYSNNPAVNKALMGNQGLIKVKMNKKLYYMSSEIVNESDWNVILLIPYSIILQNVCKAVIPDIMGLLFLTLFFIFIALFFVRKYLNPLSNLTNSLKQYGQNTDVGYLDVTGNDEISEAVKAYNKMISDRRLLELEIMQTGEKERKKIGSDLHDDLGQLLTGIAFKIMILKNDLKTKKNINDNLDDLSELISEAINKTKYIAKGLCPVSLYEKSFIYAVNDLAQNINKIYHIECNMTYNKEISFNSEIITLNIFRIIQEAINNSIKYSKSDKIDLLLKDEKKSFGIVIIDYGKGFNPEKITKGMGLNIVKYRAKLINASIKIESELNKGTRISLVLLKKDNK